MPPEIECLHVTPRHILHLSVSCEQFRLLHLNEKEKPKALLVCIIKILFILHGWHHCDSMFWIKVFSLWCPDEGFKLQRVAVNHAVLKTFVILRTLSAFDYSFLFAFALIPTLFRVCFSFFIKQRRNPVLLEYFYIEYFHRFFLFHRRVRKNCFFLILSIISQPLRFILFGWIPLHWGVTPVQMEKPCNSLLH